MHRTLVQYLSGHCRTWTYWVWGVLGTPIFVVAIIIMAGDIDLVVRTFGNSESMQASDIAAWAMICAFYACIYIGTSQRAMRIKTKHRALLWAGLAMHSLLSAYIFGAFALA